MNISIIRSGRLIAIKPFPDSLRNELTFAIMESEYKKGKMIFTRARKTMFSENPDDAEEYFAPAGFTSRVYKHLLDLGIPKEDIAYKDIRELKIEKPQLTLMEPLTDPQKEAIARVFTSACGIIWMPTGVGKTYLIKQIIRALPNTKIVITGHDSEPLKSLYDYLVKLYGYSEVTAIGKIGKSLFPGRITICHIKSLLKAPIDEVPLLIYDEVHGAASPERATSLSKVPYANMFGFSASPKGRLDQKEPIIEGLFGPIIYKMPYTAARDQGLVSDIHVHIYTVKGVDRDYDTHYKRRVYGVVRNEGRNLKIAQAAQKYGKYQQIVYALDDLEHVFRLRAYLPEHTPVYGSGSMTEKRYRKLDKMGLIPDGYKPIVAGEEFKLAEKFRSGEITKAICTSVWGEGVDFPNLEVLIRADGIPGVIDCIQVPGRITRKAEGKEVAILVDFFDDFGRTFKNRSLSRISNYRTTGYKVEMKE